MHPYMHVHTHTYMYTISEYIDCFYNSYPVSSLPRGFKPGSSKSISPLKHDPSSLSTLVEQTTLTGAGYVNTNPIPKAASKSVAGCYNMYAPNPLHTYIAYIHPYMHEFMYIHTHPSGGCNDVYSITVYTFHSDWNQSLPRKLSLDSAMLIASELV